MLLMLFVDTARRRLETLPEHLFIFIGYGARLAPLVMQLLQLVERLHNRRLQHQRFGLLAEGDLLLVVLLQVEVAQLLVDFDEAVEILDMQVVGLPQVFDVLLRHDAGLLPALLQFAELIEGMVERLVRIDQFLELLDDPELDLEVLLLLGLEVRDELVAAMAVLLEQLLELYFGAVHGRCEIFFAAPLLDELAACGLDLGAADAVESDLQRLHIPADRLHGLLFEHTHKEGYQLFLALPGKLVLGGRRFLGQLVGSGLFGRLALQFQPGILRGERRLLVREIHFGTGRHGLLAGFGLHRLGNGLDTGTLRTRRGLGFRHGLLRRRRFSHGHLCRGRSRNGFFRLGFFCRGCFHDGFRLRCCGGLGFRDFGSHFGSYGLHIFSSIADSLLGSRKIRIFSSHLSTRF